MEDDGRKISSDKNTKTPLCHLYGENITGMKVVTCYIYVE